MRAAGCRRRRRRSAASARMLGVFRKHTHLQPPPASSWGRFTSPYPSAGPRTSRRDAQNCRVTDIMSALISAPFFGQFLDAPQAAPWTPQCQKCYKNQRYFNNSENGPGRFWAQFGLQKGPKKAPKNSTFSHFGPPGGPQGA